MVGVDLPIHLGIDFFVLRDIGRRPGYWISPVNGVTGSRGYRLQFLQDLSFGRCAKTGITTSDGALEFLV